MQEKPETLKQKLNRDTAKINWSALQQQQQQSAVIEVSDQLDLIAVACEFVDDNRTQVKSWLDNLEIEKVSDEQARAWQAEDKELWAVVVAPWILVQDRQQKPSTP